MNKFISHALKFKSKYIISSLGLILGIVIDAFIPNIVKFLVDDVIGNKQLALAPIVLIALFLSYLLRGVFKYIEEYWSDKISLGVTHSVRSTLFDHILKQNGEFFVKNTPGDLLTRVRHDSENLGFSFGFILIFFIEIVVHTIVMTIALMKNSLLLSIPVLILVPLMGYLSYKREIKANKYFDQISDETALMNQTAAEAIDGIRTVKAFTNESYEVKRFSRRNKHYYDLNVSLENTDINYESATNALSKIMYALTILLGAILILDSKITLGLLASSVTYVNNLVWPMTEIGWVLSELAKARASAKKIYSVLECHNEIKVEDNYKCVDKVDISYSHVSYKNIINDVSFNLKPGKSLGIMGATGSGKSVLLSFLQRFLDPESGNVTIDGVDIKRLSLSFLRKSICFVHQDVFLFSDTIKENLIKGLDAYSDEKIDEALKLSMALSFVNSLDNNIETEIGERGTRLSGGQKQRLAIARALVRDPKVLVLDDSTSALDMKTEREFQKNLNFLNCSKIIVAHRVSSVKDCDEIIILECGKIVERGTHKELLALRGKYYETYINQLGMRRCEE